MSYYSQWQEVLNEGGNSPKAAEQVKAYYSRETDAYETLLTQREKVFAGKASALAAELGFGQDMTIFAGFLDGINESLTTPIDLEAVTEDTEISLDVDFPKLFWQMHEAKADWLYGLKAWNQVLPPEEQLRITREYRESKIIRREKIGRNDPCTCGSGKKYKVCCGKGG